MRDLLRTAAQAVSTPAGQQAVTELIRVASSWWAARRSGRTQSITDRLIHLLEEQQRQIQRLLESGGYQVTGQRAEVSLGTPSPSPSPPSEPANASGSSATSPGSDVSTGCIPCTLAHLAATAASLEEALRFARGDPQGPHHPEALRRVETALMEITNLEREDLRPDKLQAMPSDQRQVMEQYLPRIRTLRQRLTGPIPDTGALTQLAADAETLFREMHREVQGKLSGLGGVADG